MSVLEENIKRINNKLQQLLKLYELSEKLNQQREIEIKELKIHQANDLLRIAQLEQQAGILKSAVGKMNEPDKKIFEKALNQYIRDIDKCIGLLSE